MAQLRGIRPFSRVQQTNRTQSDSHTSHTTAIAGAPLALLLLVSWRVNRWYGAVVAKRAARHRGPGAGVARQRIAVHTQFGSEPELPLPAKEALYRVAQEVLNNVVKHAAATEIRLSLGVEGGLVTLGVRDNGRGFDASRPFPGHLGLKSMRERADAFGGRLEIGSEPGKGTEVQAQV